MWVHANKDRKLASCKKWRDANKEGEVLRRIKNKELHKKASKAHRQSTRLPHNVVYCIPNYNGVGGNYVGVTNNLYNRMATHKSLGKLNTAEYIILDEIVDRSFAESIESQYHDRGYHGARNTKAGS